jgi:hypothetical protein
MLLTPLLRKGRVEVLSAQDLREKKQLPRLFQVRAKLLKKRKGQDIKKAYWRECSLNQQCFLVNNRYLLKKGINMKIIFKMLVLASIISLTPFAQARYKNSRYSDGSMESKKGTGAGTPNYYEYNNSQPESEQMMNDQEGSYYRQTYNNNYNNNDTMNYGMDKTYGSTGDKVRKGKRLSNYDSYNDRPEGDKYRE